MLQERLGGAVQNRPSRRVLPTHHPHELAFEQRSQDAGRFHASDLLDVRPDDWLLIRNDRERLQRGAGQLGDRPGSVQPLDPRRIVGSGDQLEPAGNLDKLQAASLPVEVFPQVLQCRSHLGRGRVAQRGHQPID